MDFEEISGVWIPVPLRSRTVTIGELVKAHRIKEDVPIVEDKPGEREQYMFTIFPVESRRRFALARTRDDESADEEARVLKNVLLAMEEERLWNYKFELIAGWIDYIHPFLDAVQG